MENENESKKSLQSTATNVKQAAKLATDIGRVAAGDISAIKDLLLSESFWKIIICFLLIISLVGFIMGGWIAALLEFFANSWQENWTENWEEQAIQSGGNRTKLNTTGWLASVWDTSWDVAGDFVDLITGNTGEVLAAAIMEGVERNNSNIDDPAIQAAGKNPEGDDFEQAAEAVKSTPALSQELIDRLDMIKGRVLQRGMQLAKAAREQYTGDSIFVTGIQEEIEKRIRKTTDSDRIDDGVNLTIFTGYSRYISSENTNIDTTCFELTDLQAVKLLAIFCIQHDCQLTDMDMWSLMDYCGWFADNFIGEDPTSNLQDYSDTIYAQVTPQAAIDSNLKDLGYSDDVLMGIEFPALNVPIWEGTCAPQWYYEERKQIQEHNENLQEGEDPWAAVVEYTAINHPFSTEYLPEFPDTYFALDGTTAECNIYDNDSVYYFFEFRAVNKDTGEVDCKLYRGEYSTTETKFYTISNYVFTDLKPGTEYEITYAFCMLQPNADNKGAIYFNSNGAFYTFEKMYDPDMDDFIVIEELGVLETFTTKSDAYKSETDLGQFHSLSKVQTFGIVDRLFYCTANNITIHHLEYNSDKEWTAEELDQSGLTNLKTEFEVFVWPRSEETVCGVVNRSADGTHSFTYNGCPRTTNWQTSGNKTTMYWHHIMLYKYIPGLNAQKIFIGSYSPSGWDPVANPTTVFTNLEGYTQYQLYEYVEKVTYTLDEYGTIIGVSVPEFIEENYIGEFQTMHNKRNLVVYGLYSSVNIEFAARSIDDLAFELLGIWPGDLANTVAVTEKTAQQNLIGKGTLVKEGEEEQYSFCLIGGTLELVRQNGPDRESGYHTSTLMRPRTVSYTTDGPLSTVIMIYEYGISTKKLTELNQVPTSGWQTVKADGDRLTFDIKPSTTYYAYMRTTYLTQTLQEDGSVVTEQAQYLYLLDYFKASTTKEPDLSQQYAYGHLGNELLRREWTDVYRQEANAQTGWSLPITFTRLQGFQYETYVDLVMALCELRGVSYEDWDVAVQRAKELGYKQNS